MKSPELGVRIWIVILGLVLVWLIQGRVSTVLTPATFEQVVISDNIFRCDENPLQLAEDTAKYVLLTRNAFYEPE